MAEEATRPNIVLIISDDHDNEHLGFMGNETVQTPNIDALARRGTVFTTCHLTASRCRPSLASLLSGRWPHQNGIYANYHKGWVKSNFDVAGEKVLSAENSLPNLLKQAGYATYGSGKYWEGDARTMGFTHGLGRRRDFAAFARKGQEELFSFVDEQAGKNPMFIWWAPLLPHTPHNPPRRFLEMFNPEEIPVPDYITPARRKEFIRKERLSLAMEAWTDEEFGKLRAKLKENGQDENTLYVFLIDNGWCNGLPAKGSVFEKGIRTPVVFTLPGQIPANKRRDDFISSLDIYPTILSYANVKVPESAAGMDLRKHIEAGTRAGREKLFGAIYPTMATNKGKFPERDVYAVYVRSGKWKYVFYTRDVQGNVAGRPFKLHHILADAPHRRRGDQNLYNLEEDPYELKDLSQDPQHQALLKNFKQDVFAWWSETGGSPLASSKTSAVESKETNGKPNLLFIAVDDLRPDLGCYGESWMKTPNIDRLATSAMTFKRHYVQVATCGASRHALLTGLRPSVAADYNNTPFRAHRKELTARPTESFFHLLKQHGYHTTSIGKISHDWFNSGRDLPRSWSQVINPSRSLGRKFPPQAHRKAPNGKRYPFESMKVDDKGYPDGVLADAAVGKLQELKNQRFALAVGFIKPHLPFNAPKKYWDLYDPAKLPDIPSPSVPDGIDPDISLHPSFELVGQYEVPKGSLNQESYRRNLRHAYCAAVSYVDAQIGKVLDELDRLDLSRNTIVVLWGDHGWHLGDLGTWGKHTAFERALRSPLLVRLPGMKTRGQSSIALIETVDIYPTLAELFGLSPPNGLGGDSFTAILRDPDAPSPSAAFGYHRPWQNPRKPDPWGKTMRTDRYRFTVWTTERTGGEIVQVELYDHKTDPEESTNIAGKQPKLVRALLASMADDGIPLNVNSDQRICKFFVLLQETLGIRESLVNR